VSDKQILLEQHESVLIIRLNRPDRLNAWTPQMMVEMTAAIDGANDDESIGAVVVTGVGRGFCAGADITDEFASNLSRPADRNASDAAARRWVSLCRSSKPLVAAINGAAIGVGLTMILPFDRLIAARSAKLSARFVKMGLVPELASSHFLVARCGWGAASWLALSGATIQGEEAADLRLVDRVVDDGMALDEALADAAMLALNPAPPMRMIKELLTANAAETDLQVVQQREHESLAIAYTTPEHRQAVIAFLEKRAPKLARESR
jgi:2-(1,2-epoxy-1,2-dihydrophenyl)acetyl-CoA isomerase